MREMAEDRIARTLPTGTLTILFTDIEGSTRLLQDLGRGDYARLLSEHHRLVRSAIAACDGVEIKTEGDSFFAVFPRATDAITAAVQLQRALSAHEWPAGSAVAVRAGVHTGDVAVSENDYVGMDIHRAARISAAAHGGQVLLSDATRSMVEANLPTDLSIRDLGEHRLKDIDAPEHLFQLVVTDCAPISLRRGRRRHGSICYRRRCRRSSDARLRSRAGRNCCLGRGC